jgi:mannose-1-phosphate guanylyltransferase
MLYPVILAGGSGQRLWPLSTVNNPKQVNALMGEESLLQATYKRLLSDFDPQDIFVISTNNLSALIKQQIDVSTQNFILEPERKETAMAIGLAAVYLQCRDPEAIMVTVNSDAFIKETEKYTEVLKIAEKVVVQNPEKFLLIGIKPEYPETGYGYIEKEGASILNIANYDVFEVKAFKEKPDLALAKQYVADPNFLWNPAMFVFKTSSLLEWYHQFLPEIYAGLLKIKNALESGDDEKYQEVLSKVYSNTEPISIDYGLLEKMKEMLVMPVDLTWADVGHWRSLRDVQLSATDLANISNSQHIDLDSKNNLLYSSSGKLIATLGVEDMVLVETDDVIFLCSAKRAQDVKHLLKKISDKDLNKYL